MNFTWCRALAPAAVVFAALLPAHAQQQPPQPHAASAAKSVLLPARGPASVLRPRQQRCSPRRSGSQVRGSRRQPAGRARPPGGGGAAGRLREEQLPRPVQRQAGAMRSAQQENPADAGQPRRIQADMERLRGDPGPEREVSAAPSWWRWRRTIAARSISSRWRRAAAAQRAASFESLFGPKSVFAPGGGSSRTASAHGAERHLPHRLRAHLRRLLLPDLRRHQSGPLCRGRKGLPPVLPGRRGAAVLPSQSGRGHQQAVSVSSQQPYTALPNAFRYRTSFDQSCSCRRPGETWAQALKNIDDTTVEQGDIVVNDQRARQLSQPRVDAQGKPIRQAPVAPRKARSEGGPDRAAAARRGSTRSRGRAPRRRRTPSKPDPNRTVRAVGPCSFRRRAERHLRNRRLRFCSKRRA